MNVPKGILLVKVSHWADIALAVPVADHLPPLLTGHQGAPEAHPRLLRELLDHCGAARVVGMGWLASCGLEVIRPRWDGR